MDIHSVWPLTAPVPLPNLVGGISSKSIILGWQLWWLARLTQPTEGVIDVIVNHPHGVGKGTFLVRFGTVCHLWQVSHMYIRWIVSFLFDTVLQIQLFLSPNDADSALVVLTWTRLLRTKFEQSSLYTFKYTYISMMYFCYSSGLFGKRRGVSSPSLFSVTWLKPLFAQHVFFLWEIFFFW